jgi:hypothetical protein
MRILASNLDTLSDLVLRQSMYTALTSAGHELMLIVRSTVAPLMPLIAPNARVLQLSQDASDLQEPAMAALPSSFMESVRAFRPEYLLIPAPRWTPLEKQLAAQLPNAQVIGWKGCSLHDLLGNNRPNSTVAGELLQEREADWKRREQELRAREAALINREIELKARYAAQLLTAQNDLALAESRESELQTKLAHLETAQASLTRELGQLRQANEQLRTAKAELERRVNELFNSGWRRIGIKFRMARRASWEQAASANQN